MATDHLPNRNYAAYKAMWRNHNSPTSSGDNHEINSSSLTAYTLVKGFGRRLGQVKPNTKQHRDCICNLHLWAVSPWLASKSEVVLWPIWPADPRESWAAITRADRWPRSRTDFPRNASAPNLMKKGGSFICRKLVVWSTPDFDSSASTHCWSPPSCNYGQDQLGQALARSPPARADDMDRSRRCVLVENRIASPWQREPPGLTH